jgi:glycosyltransferase involved in cell wall biosynthesis
MKLAIQIPCFNEAQTLGRTVNDLPRQLAGFDSVELVVIDDGSTDGTAELARQLGVQHVVTHPRNRGLAAAFATGLDKCLEIGADVIVNTDGDHQYRGSSIADLLRPILEGEADMVVGDRQVGSIAHFSRTKKLLQRLGSWVVRWISGTEVADATSGFRAMSRRAALMLTVFSSYTYTLDTIIQAGKKGLVVVSVPVETNEKLRESRLIRSVARYVLRSALTILRIFLMYQPLTVFTILSLLPGLAGGVLLIRYAYFYAIGEGAGHIQSVVAGSALGLLAFQVFLLGLLSDLIAKNRRLVEDMTYLLRGLSYGEASDRARPAAAAERAEQATLDSG